MKDIIYLDNAATTRTANEVVEAMLPYYTENYGNPSTIYGLGQAAKKVVTKARQGIAECVAEFASSCIKTARKYLIWGLFFSLLLSFLCNYVIYHYSEMIANGLLLEPRTAPLLRIISFSIPMASIHSCINGYFYGIKKTAVPSITQIVEQIIRVTSVYAIFVYARSQGNSITLAGAVAGLVIGEAASMIVSLIAFYLHINKKNILFSTACSCIRQKANCINHNTSLAKNLSIIAIPLTLNRLIVNFLVSVEAVFIPEKLVAFGLDKAGALSIYGVLNGMALPLILFPSAITNSICVLLLPIISEAESKRDLEKIKKAVHKSISLGLLLGFLCTIFFLCTGKFLGTFLFDNKDAGTFIITLSFICPFMYVASTLGSILNGLGKTALTFIYSVVSLLSRLLFVIFLIPHIGIKGYLFGLLFSQILQTLLCLYGVREFLFPNQKITD